MYRTLSKEPAERLAIFVKAGLLDEIPTRFQFFQGQLEMALYVLMPDESDDLRYAGTPLGHPLLRTPLLLWEIGRDHMRIGHGLHAAEESLYRHLMFVFHEGMPVFDLQLVQTVPGGLATLRRYVEELQGGRTEARRRQRERIDLIIPHAEAYRDAFVRPGGWIERAEAFDYPSEDEIASFLRPEFMSLVGFAQYCLRTFPRQPLDVSLLELPGRLAELATRRLRGVGRAA